MSQFESIRRNSSLQPQRSSFFQPETEQPFFEPSPVKASPQAGIQAKLDIGEPDDAFEQEADGMADQVVNRSPQPDSQIQRMCPGCEEEEKAQPKIQRMGDTPEGVKEDEELPVQMKRETQARMSNPFFASIK